VEKSIPVETEPPGQNSQHDPVQGGEAGLDNPDSIWLLSM